MSINWVMRHETQGYVRLTSEREIWKSSARTSFALTSLKSYPGTNPISINSNSGTVYLTNQRVIYLPEKSTNEFKSFSASLLNLHDTHITVPWFGPNAWQAVVQPVLGGNIVSGNAPIELKLTFKEGGAPDFHSNFERIKERLQQALENARSENSDVRQRDPITGVVNMDSVHLDELPAYEASGSDQRPPEQMVQDYQGTARSTATDEISEHSRQSDQPIFPRPQTQESTEPPSDAPPGYEEAQQQSVQVELDRRLSNTH